MVQNAPIVEFVTGNDVTFRVIVENFGNNKTPDFILITTKNRSSLCCMRISKFYLI